MQYLRILVCGEPLLQFDTLYDEVGSTTSENLKSIILGLGTYFFTVNAMLKQKCAMRQGMRNPRGFKVRYYTDCIIELNNSLSVFPGEKASGKNCETEFNEILLNIIPNISIRQAYVQGGG